MVVSSRRSNKCGPQERDRVIIQLGRRASCRAADQRRGLTPAGELARFARAPDDRQQMYRVFPINVRPSIRQCIAGWSLALSSSYQSSLYIPHGVSTPLRGAYI